MEDKDHNPVHIDINITVFLVFQFLSKRRVRHTDYEETKQSAGHILKTAWVGMRNVHYYKYLGRDRVFTPIRSRPNEIIFLESAIRSVRDEQPLEYTAL